MLIPLSEFCLRMRIGYNRGLRRAIRGDVPGVQRIAGRWYVDDAAGSAEVEAAGSSSAPEVLARRELAAELAQFDARRAVSVHLGSPLLAGGIR